MEKGNNQEETAELPRLWMTVPAEAKNEDGSVEEERGKELFV